MSAERRHVVPVLLTALVFTGGAQSLRFFVASIAWYLRDIVGVGTVNLIPIALLPFLVAAVLPMVSLRVGLRAALWIGVLLLGLARFANQVTTDPAVEMWAAGIASAAFVGLLPLLLTFGRSVMLGGILLGITVDTAIKSLGSSLDLSYRPGIGPLVATGVIVVAMVCALWSAAAPERAGVGWGEGVRLLGLGPYLFAQFLVFQAQGWTASAGDVSATRLPCGSTSPRSWL